MSWVGIERLGSRWFVIELARNTLQDHAFGYRNDTVMRLVQGYDDCRIGFTQKTRTLDGVRV